MNERPIQLNIQEFQNTIKLKYIIYTIYTEDLVEICKGSALAPSVLSFDQVDLEDLISLVSSITSGPYTLCFSSSQGSLSS